MNFTQWRMAKKYGYRRELLTQPISSFFERLWLCTIRRQHLVKMGSHGHCYRCGKAIG